MNYHGKKIVILSVISLVFVHSLIGQETESFGRGDLEFDFHQLSFIEAGNCLKILESVGYTVGKPQFPIAKDNLPMIFSIPDSKNISVVGAKRLDGIGDGAPQQRIGIVYHHDEEGEQEYLGLLRLLERTIDIQATQVQIEAMVVELTESGSKELGMEYDWYEGDYRGEDTPGLQRNRTGTFSDDGLGLGLSMLRFTGDGTPELFKAKLKALISDEVAEVLSSPSVLTLDNRHAKIEIMKQVPILEKSDVKDDSWDINVRYEETGIILNIKPRVDRTGEWVTLQVQTEVSEALDYLAIERGDGNDKTTENIAPNIERRIVETIARIRNNHPFIVGGLIRDDSSTNKTRIPLLGSIPVLGWLFRSEETVKNKREVIIVLTPRVIRPEASDRPVMPKDSERFDFFDTRLFRETYALKAEDVYDLDFVLARPRIQQILDEARDRVEIQRELADQEPFASVADGAIPGEQAVVNRMLYGIVRKLNLFKSIDPARLILFTHDEDDPAGFGVTPLRSLLQQTAEGQSVEEYLATDFPKKVLFVTFPMPDHGGVDTDIAYPVADTHVQMIRSAQEAESKLYELGRIDGMTRPKIAFMVSSERELERLQTSVVIREILDVNDPTVIQRLQNFQVGRRIAIPEVDPAHERTFLIDRSVAIPFYHSHFYYAEFEETLDIYIEEIQKYFSDN